MKKLTRFVIEHIEITLILLIAILGFGAFSVSGLRSEFISDMSLPQIYIISIYPGGNPEDVEEDVSKVIEDKMFSLADIKDIKSQSTSNISFVTITFNDGVNLDEKLSEVRYRITQIEDDLPSELSGIPNAFIADSSIIPIFSFTLTSKDYSKLYSYLNDKIIPEINRIPGVSEITITPDAEQKVIIKFNSAKLSEKNICITDVFKLINASSISLPLGEADYMSRGGSVRYNGKFNSIDDIKNLVVGFNNGISIHLSDIADIYKASSEDKSTIYSNGEYAFSVEVMKRSDGDIVNICSKIKKILSRIDKETQGSLNINISGDNSSSTKKTINSVLVSGIMGILMAVFAIWLCLGDIKATLVIAISIPLSILITFIFYRIFNMTLNVMTLTGLVVSLGMIVDGSIVMLESVYRYLRIPGFSVKNSIIRASEDVSSSIFASAATSVVVFIPMLFLGGIIGKILKDPSLTLIFTLSSSCLVAIAAVPFFIKLIKKDGEVLKEHKKVDNIFSKLEGIYAVLLRWCLRNKLFIILFGLILLLMSFLLATKLGFTFISSVDQSEFYVEMIFPKTYTKSQILKDGEEAQRYFLDNVNGIKTCVQQQGKSFTSRSASGDNFLSYKIMLSSLKNRKMRVQDTIKKLQKELPLIFPDADIRVSNGGFDFLITQVSNGGGYQVAIYGEDFDEIYDYAQDLKKALDDHRDVASTALSTTYDNRNIILDMSSDFMTSLGVNSYETGMTSAILFRDNDVGSFTDKDGKNYNIVTRSNITDFSLNKDVLKNIKVKSSTGELIDFSRIGNIKENYGITSIDRKNKSRNITIIAMLNTDDQSRVALFVNDYISQNPLPETAYKESGGIMMLILDALVPVIIALSIAIFLVFMVMVIQFEHFFHPLIIMLSIPFCIIGVVFGLLVFNTPVSIMTVLAVVSLAGIVVNNGIILIDHTNTMRYKLRECKDNNIPYDELNKPDCDISGREYRTKFLDYDFENETLKDTVIKAGSSRIKPILMTVSTTLFGVIPMAFDKSEGSELYAPLGQAMAFGLFISTLITLFFIPTLYYIREKSIITKRKKHIQGEVL